MNISLGYEIGTGKRVTIPVNHTVVLGQTQLSGKTTTLEAMVTRSGLRAVGFITKPGEKSFRQQNAIPAFFSESTITDYWKYVVSIVENLMAVKLGWQERGWIVKLCQDYEDKSKAKAYRWKRPKALRELLANVRIALPHLRGTAEMICMQLQEYLESVVREIGETEFSAKLDLQPGINVMDVTELSDGLKALVIRSVIEHVHKRGRKTVIIIPEAWKFIPEGRSTPVKLALEGLIREGAGVGNFVWMDSQDLRGVDKLLLRSVIVWLFGVQRQKNEVASTLASIPDHPKPTATEIMQLGKGEFYVCYGQTLVRTYVQPAGMEDAHAQAIARGEESPESWRQIARALDEEAKDERTDGIGESIIQDDGKKTTASALAIEQSPDIRGNCLITENLQEKESIAAAVSDHPGERQPEDNKHLCEGRVPVAQSESKCSFDVIGEDAVWKEKYEELKANYDQLVRTHDAIANRLNLVERSVKRIVEGAENGNPHAEAAALQFAHNYVHKAAEFAIPSAGGSTSASAPGGSASALVRENGAVPPSSAAPEFHEIYRYVMERAAKEQGALSILFNRPELRVRIERKAIEADGGTMQGRMALLVSEGFFDKPRDTSAVMEQCVRRGWLGRKTPLNLLDKKGSLGGLVELGFVTKEPSGYQAVPGMKVCIMEIGKAVAAR